MSNSPAAERNVWSQWGLVAGPLVALALGLAPQFGGALDAERPAMNSMAAVTALMAIWWLTDAVPAAVTGMLPLVLFPALQLAPPLQTAAAYGNRLLFLFLGGFLLAMTIQECGLHRRVALAIMSVVGASPSRLVLGTMLATALLSMWMSNTATTVLMLPIATSLLSEIDAQPATTARQRHFGVGLMLGVAYAASMGGMATLVGTPTNVLFKEIYASSFAGREPEITFAGWMLIGVPVSLLLVLVTWWVLTRWLFPLGSDWQLAGRDVIAAERQRLGPISPAERRAGLLFLATALLWIFREPVLGWGWAPSIGLGQSPGVPTRVDDSTVAIAMAMLCFVMPRQGWRGAPLLDWQATYQVPWGILLLFGGGLALAEGLSHTGLDAYLAEQAQPALAHMSPLAITVLTALGITALSELTSNIACVNLSLPILAVLAPQVGCDPRLLMVAATLAASSGFMLPVATAPNAIAYGTGRIQARDMVRAGLVLDLVAVALIVAVVVLIGGPALGISTHGVPEWATPPAP